MSSRSDNLAPERLSFRRMAEGDLPLMHAWLTTGFVREWYGDEPDTLEAVIAKYLPRIHGDVPTHPYITLYNNTPTRSPCAPTRRLASHT